MKFIIAAFMMLLVNPAFAQSVQEWIIVKQASTLAFTGEQMGAPFKGSFSDFNGTIHFDPANLPASKVDITINTGSIDATSPDRTKYAVMPDWLDTTKFPAAHFTTTQITRSDASDSYVAKGNLTLRDTTLPVTLPFTLTVKDNQAVMTGKTAIKRLAYGIGQGEWKDTETVGDVIKINVNLTAIKK